MGFYTSTSYTYQTKLQVLGAFSCSLCLLSRFLISPSLNRTFLVFYFQLGIPLLPLANDRHVFRGLAIEDIVGESGSSDKIKSSERVGPTVEERQGADKSPEDHAADWAMEPDCGTSADTATTVDSGGVIRRVEFITEAVLDALADWRERSHQSQDVS